MPAAVLVAGGLALGLNLYVLSQTAVSPGEMPATRRHTAAFGRPLRLTDRLNVLLIGIDVTMDNRRRVLNVARADTLILVSFDPDGRRITALSIPRDTRAEIPRYGVTKINASYAYGGPRLTIRTVEQLLGVRVDAHVKLGAESFGRLIDAVGGVEIDVEKDMQYTDTWAGFSVDLKKGRQRLTGDQATGYIRFRHDALGDIGRVERQHKVMVTLLRQIRQPSTLLAGPRLLQAFARHTQTDLTPTELLTLGLFALRAVGEPPRVHTLPGTFAPLYWEPDAEKTRALVADLFYGLSADDLTGVAIEVQNASGVPGLGRQAAARIAALGFRTVSVRTAEETAEATTIVDRSDRPRVARALASALGAAAIRRGPGAPGAAVTVLLARDAAGKLSGGLLPRTGQ